MQKQAHRKSRGLPPPLPHIPVSLQASDAKDREADSHAFMVLMGMPMGWTYGMEDWRRRSCLEASLNLHLGAFSA